MSLAEVAAVESLHYSEEAIQNSALSVFQSADHIPALALYRDAVRTDSRQLLEDRRQLLQTDAEAVPLPVDALGTARQVVAAEGESGRDSIRYGLTFRSLVLDFQRLLGEANRANTYEIFEESGQIYDPDIDDFVSYGVTVGSLTDNGISPHPQTEEEERRINERVEERGTYQPLGRMLLGSTTVVERVPTQVNVATVSQCADWAIRLYRAGNKGGFGGYVPNINKIMIRNVRFDSGSVSRYEEQIGISGEYITPEIVNLALTILDPELDGRMDKTTVHGTQMVTEAAIGAIDYVEFLDLLASEFHGIEIFMGEPLPAGHTRDYQRVQLEAQSRRQELRKNAVWLARRAVELEKKGIPHHVANHIIEAEVKDIFLEICRQKPAKAREVFDEATAVGFEEVQQLQDQGLFHEAAARLQIVEASAPAAQFCGADSCGLEVIAKEHEAAVAKRLKAEHGDTILRDTIRQCTCGAKNSIVYAFNKVKVNKLCEGCGKFESKVSVVKEAA
jgi:hypothetical protein